jgi:uncharacterized protein
MPRLEGLKVIRSRIHGYGVIALRQFKEGDIVVYGDGVLYREHEEFDDTYALLLPGYEPDEDGEEGPPMYLDLACQTRWINHCCDPNTEVDTAFDPETDSAVAWWVALRDIEPGEELSYDYAFSAHLAEPCNCGAASCRGLIVDESELDEVSEELRPLIRQPATRRRSA